MKISKLNFILAALAVLLIAQTRAEGVRYVGTPPGKGSHVKLEGASTLHDWTVESKLIAGTLELDPEFDADLKTLKTTPKASIRIPVRQLSSDKTEMNNVMYQALNATNHSTIEYKLLDLKPKDSKFEATGALTVAGVTRTNTMPVSFERLDKSKIKISGELPIKMTDFKVKPPVLAIVTTADDVKISFDWVVEKKDAAPK